MDFSIRLFAFCNFTLGFLFVIRTAKILRQRHLLTEVTLTKIGTAYLLMLLGVVPLISKLWFLIVVIYVPPLLFLMCEAPLRLWREKCFRDQFLPYLDDVILEMRAGRSFRTSLRGAYHNHSDTFFQQKIADLVDLVVFSQQVERQRMMSSFAREILCEFRKADQQSHRALSRMQNLRFKLKTESEFRRRSGQVTVQARMQAVILTGCYVALLAFVISRYRWGEVKTVIGVSLMLMTSGHMIFYLILRRQKWKV